MRNILAIQLKRIGDLILTVPALQVLRNAWPDANISLIIDGDSAGVAPAILCANRVLIYKKNALNIDVFRRLLFRRFDVALDFTGTDRSSLLASLSHAERRITFQSTAKTQIRSRPYTDIVESSVRERHTIDHAIALLSVLELSIPPQASSPELQLHIPGQARKRIASLIKSLAIPSSFAVIHAGAARAEKYWQSEKWAEVIDFCQQEFGLVSLIIGGSSPMEKKAIAEIRQHSKSKFIDLSGRLKLMESAALIAQARLFIGMDSGPSHLAAASQTPQITLFGPTNPFHWRARHSHSIVLQGGKSNPLLTFDPRAQPGRVNDLSTADVINAITSLLQPACP